MQVLSRWQGSSVLCTKLYDDLAGLILLFEYVMINDVPRKVGFDDLPPVCISPFLLQSRKRTKRRGKAPQNLQFRDKFETRKTPLAV